METILKEYFKAYACGLLLLGLFVRQPACAQTAVAQTAVAKTAVAKTAVADVKGPAELPLSARVLHPRLREWAYPKDGVSLEKDKLHLLWPGQKGKAVKYRVRIARDSLFKQSLFLSPSQKWAVYTVRTPMGSGRWYWQYGWQASDKEEWKWSPAYAFQLSASKGDQAVSKSPEEILNGLKGAHPRLFGMDKNLALFRSGNSGNPEAAAFVSEV